MSVGGEQVDKQLAVSDEGKVNGALSAEGERDVKGLAKDDNDGNQADKLLADIKDKLLVVDIDSEVKGPMSANCKGQVEEPLTIKMKRKMVAPRQVRQSTQQSTNIKDSVRGEILVLLSSMLVRHTVRKERKGVQSARRPPPCPKKKDEGRDDKSTIVMHMTSGEDDSMTQQCHKVTAYQLLKHFVNVQYVCMKQSEVHISLKHDITASFHSSSDP